MQIGQGTHGMQTFNQSLSDLVQRGLLTRDIAIARSSQPDELENMLMEGKGLSNVQRTAKRY
jgi:twitching motility protein PilT